MTAMVISGYLAWTAFTASEVAGCSGGEVFDCGHVLTSRYAKVFGIPVSAPAFGLYATMLAVLVFFRQGTPEKLLRFGWGILTVGSLAAGLAALWFVGVQVFELEHLCAYCLGAHTCGLILSGIILWKRPLGTWRTGSLSGISVAAVAVMIAIQVNSEPPQTFVVEHHDDTEMVVTDVDGAAGSDVFGPPEVFDAPGAELIAPPVFAPPVFAPPVQPAVFEPPVVIESGEPISDAQPVSVEPKNVDEDPVTEYSPEVSSTEVTVSVEPDVESPEDDRDINIASAALLFFSPSATSVATRFLSFDEEPADEDSAEETTDEPVAEVKAQKPPERLVSVSGNKFSLNTRHWPLLGDPDAKYIFVEMFDYTCPHCRNTHKAIDGAFKKFGDDLAIVALPVPLDGSCNDTVTNTSSSHRNACELARLSVAVWRVDRSKFKEFHDWMFKSTRSSSSARAQAEKLVGKEKLAAELKLPHVKSYISRHVDLYKRVGRGSVPKLMFPKTTMTGSVSSTSILCNTIERELAKK